MRFLADMGISQRTVLWLREQKYDIVHLREQGLQRLKDSEIMIKANQEQRIILTIDLDFAQLLAMSGAKFPSIILFRLGNDNYSIINERISLVLSQYSNYLVEGAIISVTDKNIRVKKLPI